MATITKRKNEDGGTTYRVEIRLKGHPRESASFDRLADAKRWSAQSETEIWEGCYFKTSEARKHTLADAIDRYLADVLPSKRSQACPRQYLAWWRSQLASCALADVSPALIEACRDTLSKQETNRGGTMKGSSVNRYLATLSHLFTIAVKEWQWTEENPLERVGKLKEPRGRVRFLSEPEFDRLLEALAACNPALLPITWIAIATRLRKGSILNLRWQDLDRGQVAVQRTKNDEPISLPLVGPALKAVREWARVRRSDTDLVFPSPELPHQPLEIGKTFPTAVLAAGVEDFHFHDLRHYADRRIMPILVLRPPPLVLPR